MMLQVCVVALCVTLAGAMTSDPSYYSQTPVRPRLAPYPLSYPPRTAAYSYTPRRAYDTDYTGRQMRYREDPVDRRVASYEDGYPQPARTGYRRLSYEAPSYADDRGRIAGSYMDVGSRGFGGSRPYQQAYMGDASLI